jgi:hypothetical protein
LPQLLADLKEGPNNDVRHLKAKQIALLTVLAYSGVR